MGGAQKTKTKTILCFAVPFSPPSTLIKLTSEYTHVQAHTTAHLKWKKKNPKKYGMHISNLQKSTQVSSSRQKYLAISSTPIQQANFLSTGFHKAKLKSKL